MRRPWQRKRGLEDERNSPRLDPTEAEAIEFDREEHAVSANANANAIAINNNASSPPDKKKTPLELVSEILLKALLLSAIVLGFLALAGFAIYKSGQDSITTSTGYDEPLGWNRLGDWTSSANPEFRTAAEAAGASYDGNSFDQLALGVHHQNSDPQRAYYYFTLAASRGSNTAARLRQKVDVTERQKSIAMDDFTKTLRNGGRDGNFLLGLLYLQNDAFSLAQHPLNKYCATAKPSDKLRIRAADDREKVLATWPPCEKNFQLQGAGKLPFPNLLLPRDNALAYGAFARATVCIHSEAGRWLTAMRNAGLITGSEAARLESEAAEARTREGDAFCRGAPTPPTPTAKPVVAGGSAGNGQDRGSGAGGVAEQLCALAPRDGLQKAQRERPGRSGYDPANDATDAPICPPGGAGGVGGAGCTDSADALAAADEARVCLRLGDAMLSAGDVDYALQYYRASIARGRQYGAQSSIVAGDRLRALSITCEYSTASLARIARGAPGAQFIDLEHRQRALKALGYYNYLADGKYGAQTREAVRAFQREIGFDETGSLSSLETVLLICQAAEAKSDPDSQNVLGIMYAAGLGVVQNTDLAIEWFERAMRRGSGDAALNLARIFATGTILSSYRLCDIIENDDRAEAYFDDAKRLGNPVATATNFAAFRDAAEKTSATGLEKVGRSCGVPPADPGAGQNE